MIIPMVGSEILLVEVEVGMCAVKRAKGEGMDDLRGWLRNKEDKKESMAI